MSTTPRGSGSKPKSRHGALHSRGKASKNEPPKQETDSLSEDESPKGLELPQKSLKWNPENKKWVRGMVTILIVATVPIAVTIGGIGLLSQRATIQDISVFLSVALTPVSGVVGFWFGRRRR